MEKYYDKIDGKKCAIRIYMIHPKVRNEKELYGALRLENIDELKYEFVWDAKYPQFIIVTDQIYTDLSLYREFGRMYRDDAVIIFMACECVAPDLNLFDYAICFDDSLAKDRVISWAHRSFYQAYISKRKNELEYDNELAREALSNKTGFCNFIYSNPQGHKNRERIFEIISSYKKVDSLGGWLNNSSYNDGNETMLNRVKNSVELKSKYKFSIAFENATYRGYTSEKVFTSLEAHSVPIYWGNPEIGKVINEKAIINCHQYETFEQVLERVKEIDSNEHLWIEMICEPWLTKEQELEEREREETYYRFLESIFLQNYTAGEGVKRGSGTYANIYKDFFFGSNVQCEKVQTNLELCMQWIRLLHREKSFVDFLKQKNYRTAAVYGMGALGVAVYEELEKEMTVYGLDRGNPVIPTHMRCLRLSEVDEALRPDVVIVTVLWDMDRIAEELDRLLGCDVYSISEIIGKVLDSEAGII